MTKPLIIVPRELVVRYFLTNSHDVFYPSVTLHLLHLLFSLPYPPLALFLLILFHFSHSISILIGVILSSAQPSQSHTPFLLMLFRFSFSENIFSQSLCYLIALLHGLLHQLLDRSQQLRCSYYFFFPVFYCLLSPPILVFSSAHLPTRLVFRTLLVLLSCLHQVLSFLQLCCHFFFCIISA